MVKMKDSGIEWIGEIPEDWKLTKLKYICSNITDGSHFSPETKTEGKPYVTVSNVNNDFIDFKNAPKISEYDFKILEKNGCKPKTGDVLLAKDGTVGRTAIVKENDFVILSSLAILTPNNQITSAFLKYSLDGDYLQKQMQLSMAGSALRRITISKINKYSTILPPLETQKRIVKFLDKKCTKINALNEDIQKQIETLEQYKKSVITEAVTKGINSDTKMKDSGIKWIGEIPEHWEVKPLGNILIERIEKNYPVKTDVILSLSIDIGITLYSEKTTNLDRFKDDITGYKLAHEGDLVLNSMNVISGAEGISAYYGCVSPVYYVLYDNEKDNHYCARFYDYHFKTLTLRKYLFSIGKGILAIDRGEGRVNTCRLKVSNYDLKHMHFPVPPKNEMEAIVKYLDAKCSKIDSIIASKKQQLETLEEYKKSLIFEYVTGKKEV